MNKNFLVSINKKIPTKEMLNKLLFLIKILKAKIKERESELPIGTAVILDGRKKFGIAMSDKKVLFLDELQPAGKKPMNSADFLNGYTIESGEIIWEYGNS